MPYLTTISAQVTALITIIMLVILFKRVTTMKTNIMIEWVEEIEKLFNRTQVNQCMRTLGKDISSLIIVWTHSLDCIAHSTITSVSVGWIRIAYEALTFYSRFKCRAAKKKKIELIRLIESHSTNMIDIYVIEI